MRWRRILIALALAAAVAAILFALVPREPKYQGRTLSEWLCIAAPSVNPDPESARAVQAVHHIGADGLPWLIKWMSYEPPTWKTKLAKGVEKLPQPIADKLDNFINADDTSPNTWAQDGFEILGPKASAAVPDLLLILARDPDWFHMASTPGWRALSDIGRAGIPLAITVMTNRANSVDLRATAARCLGYMDSSNNPAVPFLLECVRHKNVRLSEAAAESLAELHVEPGVVVPILTNLVQFPDPEIRMLSLHHLKNYGEAAKIAAPAVFMAMNDSDPEVRQIARHTLYEIDPASRRIFSPGTTEAWMLKTWQKVRDQGGY